MQYTKENFKKGLFQIENDMSDHDDFIELLEELSGVTGWSGNRRYYKRSADGGVDSSEDSLSCHTIKASDFLALLKEEDFKWGEEVEVSDFSDFKILGSCPPYNYGCKGINGGHIAISKHHGPLHYKYARRPQPKVLELTIEEIAAKFNVPADQIKIKK